MAHQSLKSAFTLVKFSHTLPYPIIFHSCVMEPPFSLSDRQAMEDEISQVASISPKSKLKAGSEVCGRGKGGASWPSHCHSSISVRHNLQQQVTATATTCQKAKVLNEHQPSVDTVSRLSLAWNCQLIPRSISSPGPVVKSHWLVRRYSEEKWMAESNTQAAGL